MQMMSAFGMRFLRSLRWKGETAIVVVSLLVLIGSEADSTSISELLSDLEAVDSGVHPLRQQQQQQQSFVEDADDVDDDVTAMAKRSPWSQYEVNVDNLRQKIIRSKMFSNRQKHSLPPRQPPTEKYLDKYRLPVVGEAEVSTEEAYIDGYVAGWLNARAYLEETGLKWPSTEVDGIREEVGRKGRPVRQFRKRDVEEEDDGVERHPSSRSTSSGVHPVYLGMGQESANAALSTFASLLAEEEKRKNSEHPVRFIGKRRYDAGE